MDVRVGPQRKLSTKELMLLNCGVGEDSWESLEEKEIQPVNPKGNQPWIFIGITDAEAEAPVLWPPAAKIRLIGKDHDAWKNWGQKENRATEDRMIGWHHWLNGHEFEETQEIVEHRGTWCAAVLGVARSRTQLSRWTTATATYGVMENITSTVSTEASTTEMTTLTPWAQGATRTDWTETRLHRSLWARVPACACSPGRRLRPGHLCSLRRWRRCSFPPHLWVWTDLLANPVLYAW